MATLVRYTALPERTVRTCMDRLEVAGKPQGLECARALIVVLRQQPAGVNAAEHRCSDRIVRARHQPPAELVAAAQLEPAAGSSAV